MPLKLVALLRAGTTVSFPRLIMIACLAGFGNAMVLAVVNAAAETASPTEMNFRFALMFAVTVSIYVLAQRKLMRISATEVETIIHRIRVSLADKVRRADLAELERLGTGPIYASISKDTQAISQAATMAVIGAQSAVLIVFTMLYIAFLSRVSFLLTAVFVALASLAYLRRGNALDRDFERAIAVEGTLFERLQDLLGGFKELKMHSARSAAVFEDFSQTSKRASEIRTRTMHAYGDQFIVGQLMVFLLLATLVFIVPAFGAIDSKTIIKTTTAVLFIIGPITTLIQSVPTIASANASAENIDRLDRALSEVVGDAVQVQRPVAPVIETIELQRVEFAYGAAAGVEGFRVGPIDLTVHRGETLFLTGGNGSGKSTLIKLLTGLYRPTRGRILVNGEAVTPAQLQSYRDSMAVIFSDFHLFRRLYGQEPIDEELVSGLLRELEIEDKVAVSDGAFTTTDLSAGQRKRLALAVAMLEDRQILIFDEWAADQDPPFRKRFYHELLALLKARGKTIVAVTHDDRYFDVADRRLMMEEGRVLPPNTP